MIRISGHTWTHPAWILGVGLLYAACSSPDPSTSKEKELVEEVKENITPRSNEALGKALIALKSVHENALVENKRKTPQDFIQRLKKREGTLRTLLDAIYEGGSPRLRFVEGDHATESINAMANAVESLPSHGISQKYFPLESTRTVLKDLELYENQLTALAKEAETPEGQRLRKAFDTLTPEANLADLTPHLVREKLDDSHLPLLVSLETSLEEYRTIFEKKAASLNEMELLLMESFLEYSTEFQHSKVAHPFRAMKNRRTAFGAFRERLLNDVTETDFTTLENTLNSWAPRNPLYKKIRAGMTFYKNLTEDVEQVKIDATVLKPGDSGEAVKKLQARMMQEGYYSGENTGVMDKTTVEAIKAYQRTHQLDEDGVVGGGTIRSINVPFKRRSKQLELGLQRWRESAANQEGGFYVRVNLAKFEAQFWQDETLERAHRVIIGSNAFERDEDRGIQGQLNRTKLFSDEIERLVLNPLWHVPARIKETELDLELIDDPDFYEKNNYTVETLANGTEVIYQNAGPGNALGRVKFLFPNEHSIYMHDTPRKKLFMNRIRAYSHGCMRLHNALEVAEYILERQGLMTPKEVRRIVESKKERGVTFKEKIPIHIDYNTIGVTSDGEMMFLLDIYEYDKAYFAGEVPLPTEPDKIE